MVKVFYLYAIVAFLGGNLIALVTSFLLPYWVSSEYAVDPKNIFILMNGLTFFGLYTMIFPYYIHHEKNKSLGLQTTLTTLMNIILLVILVPKYAVAGAAWAQFFTQLIRFFIFFVCIHSTMKLPWLQFSKIKNTKIIDP